MASGSVKLNQVTVGVVPKEESISVDTGVEPIPSTAAASSPHRLRLMEGPHPPLIGSTDDGFGFFWSGLLTGVKEEHGGGRASTFTIPPPDPPTGPFFLGTWAGAVVVVNDRAGVATGFAPHDHIRLWMGCNMTINMFSNIWHMGHSLLWYVIFGNKSSQHYDILGMHWVPTSA